MRATEVRRYEKKDLSRPNSGSSSLPDASAQVSTEMGFQVLVAGLADFHYSTYHLLPYFTNQQVHLLLQRRLVCTSDFEASQVGQILKQRGG